MTFREVGLCTFAVILSACGGEGSGTEAGPPDAGIVVDAAPVIDAMPVPDASQNPTTLRASGLYATDDSEALAPGVRIYEPQGQLWSDGASKERWIYLPPGTQIDTSDMNFWVYPRGTRLWKEFWSEGVRVETRLLYKLRSAPGVGSWFMGSFVWNEEQTDAVLRNAGEDDALGTEHDVPSYIECLKCHGGMADIGIGVSAFALDHTGSGLTLNQLIAEGRLSHPPAGSGPIYFPLPGSSVEQEALRYVHANCGSCHNPSSEIFQSGDARMNFRIFTDSSLNAVTTMPAYTTAVCQQMEKPVSGAEAVIVPGSPETSAAWIRMGLRSNKDQMPQIATDVVDENGRANVAAWISSMSGSCP